MTFVVREDEAEENLIFWAIHREEHTHTLDDMDMWKQNNAVKMAIQVELRKGYSAGHITNIFLSKGRDGTWPALQAAKGQYLNRITVQSWKRSAGIIGAINNLRLTQTGVTWKQELAAAETQCIDLGLRHKILHVQNQAGAIVHGIVWASNHCLRVLAARGYLTLLDSTHKTNQKKWKLFTWMVRTEVDMRLSCAGALIDGEDGNTIGQAIITLRHWIEELALVWQIHYALTDDSAAEQRAFQIGFPPTNPGVYGRVIHLFCRWHFMQTCDRKLSGDLLRDANKHIKAALFGRRSEAGCIESIQAALDSIAEGTIIRRNGNTSISLCRLEQLV
ncbi:hypothetical protein BDZ45DRAFT_675324 [Acephala macrosclerotiorum]|nr:hypothetical protein BDZ45DRAFT_675324 [Acephala macrosclerotiorum]